MSTATTAPAVGSKQAELVKQEMRPIVAFIDSDEVRRRVAAVVPKHCSPDRLIRMALLSISKNQDLRKCTPDSLLLSICDAAALGLDCGGALGQAYLVPFKTTATLIIGYRGMIALARKSGEISTIYAHVVRYGDEFTYELGLNPILEHKPRADIGASVTHAYAVCKFKDGSYQFDVMTRAEIDRIRSRSMAKDNGPWVTDFDEMSKKTVLRRLSKLLPMTPEAAIAIHQSDEGEYGGFGNMVATETRSVSSAISDTKARLVGTVKPNGETVTASGEVLSGEPTAEEKQAILDRERREAAGDSADDWGKGGK